MVSNSMLNDFFSETEDYLVSTFGGRGSKLFKLGTDIENTTERFEFFRDLLHTISTGDTSKLRRKADYRIKPIGVEKFLTHEYYLGLQGQIYPAVMEHLKEINSGSYTEAVLTGCVTGDTEYLSPTGWERISTYSGGKVAQVHKGICTFVTPTDYICLPSTGWYTFKTKYGLSQVLSPDHRMLFTHRKTNKPIVDIAENIANIHNNNVMGFEHKIPTSFIGGGEGLELSDNTIQVLVACYADGYMNYKKFHQPRTRKRFTVIVKKERKITRLRALLKDYIYEWSERPHNSREGYIKFTIYAPIEGKGFDIYWWGASTKQLGVIANEALHWDGNIRGSSLRFYSQSKQDADYIQYAVCSTGSHATLTTDRYTGNKPLYLVGWSKGRTSVGFSGKDKKQVEYKPPQLEERKYCFSVPSGFLVLRHNNCVFITGNSIGTAKTTIAVWTTAYQLYLLSCLRDPQRTFGLDKSSEIIFIFQSINEKLAKDLDYARFRSLIKGSPYFLRHFKFNKDIESELRFPKRVIVKPVSGAETGAIGQNVIGGVIDELNYMAVTEKSKNSIDGGTYDQAIALYNSIARRRKSRFMVKGKLPGLLCLVSSKRYPGQFTDIKEAEAIADIAEHGKSTIYIYDKRTWEVLPKDKFIGTWFYVFIGDETHKPRVLSEEEDIGALPQSMVMKVPTEYKNDFDTDLMNALRELGGVSTMARHPFLINVEKVIECFGRNKIKSVLSRTDVDFHLTKISLNPKAFINPEEPRWVHIDLALTGDAAGVAIGYVDKFKHIKRGEEEFEILPCINFDCTLEVRPPKGGEIQFHKIRSLIYKLKEYGLNIKWISFDSFQCISGDAEVWTNRGLIRADNIIVGDLVQSRIGVKPVTKVWGFGTKPTIQIITKDGTRLSMTRNHKVEACKKETDICGAYKKSLWSWIKSEDLKVGDTVRIWESITEVKVSNTQPLNIPNKNNNTISCKLPKTLTIDLSELLGIIYGDGYISADGITITGTQDEIQYCKKLIFRVTGLDCTITDRETYADLRLSSRYFRDYLLLNGFDKADTIPDTIKKSPADIQSAFIRGLFSTDGSVARDDGGCSYSSKNILWVEYIQKILIMVHGIHSRITVIDREKYPGYPTSNKYQYLLSVRGSRSKFLKAIGFCYEYKQNILIKHKKVNGRFIYSKIKSITEGESKVYDFEVADDHSYVVNGFISHNSTDSQQILRTKGFVTGLVSMDTTTKPYDVLKTAIYDGRVSIPEHPKLMRELQSLERDQKKGKIDHPSSGKVTSKDISDSVAGVVYGLSTRRETWTRHNISLNQIPASIMDSVRPDSKDNMKTG